MDGYGERLKREGRLTQREIPLTFDAPNSLGKKERTNYY